MTNFKQKNIIAVWFLWRFYQAPKALLLIWKNFLLFGLDFFSIPTLITTLFSPWRRYKWTYPKRFDPRGYLETFISNVFSRIFGAAIRFFLIIAGILTEVLILIIGPIAILLWLAVPFMLVILIVLNFLIF